MTIVYDAQGNEFKVPYAIDVQGWLDDGYTLEKPEEKKTRKPKEVTDNE